MSDVIRETIINTKIEALEQAKKAIDDLIEAWKGML